MLPKIEEKGIIVTDGERAFRNVISDKFPSMPRLRCWNHLTNDIDHWVRSRGGVSFDCKHYKNQVKQLLHSQSRVEFENNLTSVSVDWDVVFNNYFIDNIYPEIDAFGRWSLEKYGLYNPFSGLTTNMAEGKH